MSPTISSVRVLTLPGPTLSREAVAELARQISTAHAENSGAIVIECHSVQHVLPPGLCALLDLRAQHEGTRWALVRLSKGMLGAVLQMGLAERFTICADEAAASRSFATEGC